MKALTVILLLIYLGGSAISQTPDTLWTAIWGDDDDNSPTSVLEASDGGFFITTNQVSNLLVIKYDASGNFVWSNAYDYSDFNYGYAADRTSDGNNVIAGFTGSYDDVDAWLLKINNDGDTLWTRTFGDSEAQGFFSVKQTNDDGYIAAGMHNNLCYWILADQDGYEVWQKSLYFDSLYTTWATSVDQATDDNILITGYLYNMDNVKIFVIKSDIITGDTIWTKIISPNNHNRSYKVKADYINGGFVVAGETMSGHEPSYLYLIKFNNNGDTLWTRMYGDGVSRYGEGIQDLDVTSDGGYILSTELEYLPSHLRDIYVVRTNSIGDPIWDATYGPENCVTGDAYVKQTADGGYIIAGDTKLTDLADYDIYLVRLGAEQTGVPGDQFLIPSTFSIFQNYPNPFNASTIINYELSYPSEVTIDIYDILGRRVTSLQNGYLPAGNHQVVWHTEDVPSGIYFYKLQAENFSETKRMTLIK